MAHFFLAWNNIPLSVCTTVYSTIYLLRYILVVYKFPQLLIKLLKKRQKRSQNELQVTGKSLRLAIKHKLKKTTGLEEIMIMKVWKFKLFGKVVSKCLRI